MGRFAKDMSAAFALIAEGKRGPEICAALGVCHVTLIKWKKANNIAILPGRAPGPVDTVRAERIGSMFRQGVTMAKIGADCGITRARVQQILSKMGLHAKDGGQFKKADSNAGARIAKRNARCLQKWGVSYADMRAGREDGTLPAFISQRNTAASRAVTWGLTYRQWLDLWIESGKLPLRGRGKGKYCMSRIKDAGGYEIGNVHIQLTTENSREAVAKWRGKPKKANRGVFHLYPGLSTPWLAKSGRKCLGLFATEDAAVAARVAFIEQRTQTA